MIKNYGALTPTHTLPLGFFSKNYSQVYFYYDLSMRDTAAPLVS